MKITILKSFALRNGGGTYQKTSVTNEKRLACSSSGKFNLCGREHGAAMTITAKMTVTGCQQTAQKAAQMIHDNMELRSQ